MTNWMDDASAVDAKIAELKQRINGGPPYESADAYYADKDWLRELRAHKVGKTPWEYDPAGYHFPRNI